MKLIKRVILGFVLLVNVVYGEKSNLEYFKTYIHFTKKIFNKPTHAMKYNVGVIINSYEMVDNECQITYDIFPYFQPLWAKAPFFPSFKDNRFDLKQGKGKVHKFPKMQLKIADADESMCKFIYDSLKKTNSKTQRFSTKMLKDSREKLRNKRFDNHDVTVKFGSLIERVIKKCLAYKEIYVFKKSSILETKSATILIKDLCYSKSAIDSCQGDDLVLSLNNNVLQPNELSETPSISFFEKVKNIFTSNDTKTKKTVPSKTIKVKVENLERFKYSDQRYYLYFYNSRESCNQDTEYLLSKVKIKESFIDDINNREIDSHYKWLKGRGFVDNQKLKFGI